MAEAAGCEDAQTATPRVLPEPAQKTRAPRGVGEGMTAQPERALFVQVIHITFSKYFGFF